MFSNKNVSKYYNNFNNFIKIREVEVKNNILKQLVVTRFARPQKVKKGKEVQCYAYLEDHDQPKKEKKTLCFVSIF